MNNSKSSPGGKAIIYPLSHNEVKSGQGDKIFDFFRKNTGYVYQLSEFKDKKTGVRSGYIGSEFKDGVVGGVDSEFNRRMDSNLNLIATKDVNSHDGGGIFSGSNYPSGFH